MSGKTENVKTELVRVATSVENLAGIVTKLDSKLDASIKHQEGVNEQIFNRLNNGMKTNWGLVVSVVIALMTFVGILFAVYLEPIKVSIKSVNENINTLKIHERENFESIIRHDERLKILEKSRR